MSYVNFSPVDKFAFTYGSDMDPDFAPIHFLGDISICFESSESTSVSYTNDWPMDYQESAGLMPHESMEETPQPGGILAPLVSDYVPVPADTPFDGEICTQDTYLKDVKRFMNKHGKAPHISAFVQESFTVRRRRVSSSKPKNVSSNIPTTPVRKQVAPLPRRARQAVARSSVTVSDTPDHTPKRTLRQKKDAAFKGFVSVFPQKKTHVLDALNEEPVSKKVKKELINSTSTADELLSLAPVSSSIDVSAVPSSPPSIILSLPETMSESSQELPSTPASTKRTSRKRKLDERKEEDCKPEKVAGQAKPVSVCEKWEKRDDTCSMRNVKGAGRYRCDLCHKAERTLITKTFGDMKRHLQSLLHQKKDFQCTTPGCDKAYTRIDALKRHQSKCV